MTADPRLSCTTEPGVRGRVLDSRNSAVQGIANRVRATSNDSDIICSADQAASKPSMVIVVPSESNIIRADLWPILKIAV